jgi:hypothetical protein
VALLLPFAAQVLSGTALLVASFAAAGAANHVGYGEWVPTAGGLLLALPLLAAGSLSGWLIWQRISRPYRLQLLKLIPAWSFLLALAILGIAYIATIDNPQTYEGSFNSLTDKYEPNLTLETFYFVSAGLSVFLLGAIYLSMRFLYLGGVERPGLDVPEGIDPIGSLISDRQARR